MAGTDLPKRRDSDQTKKRILAAAIKHFGIYGYEGSSLRRILADADVAVASANYHFGSKSNLLIAAVDHYIVATHETRFALMAAAIEKPPIHERLKAMTAAYLQPHLEVTVGNQDIHYARFLNKLLSEDDPVLRKEIDRGLLPVRKRMHLEMKRCIPGRSETEIAQALLFLLGVLAVSPFKLDPVSLATNGLRQEPVAQVVEEASRFAYAGIVSLLNVPND